MEISDSKSCTFRVGAMFLGKALTNPAYNKPLRAAFEKYYLEKYGVPYVWKTYYDISEEIENENTKL